MFVCCVHEVVAGSVVGAADRMHEGESGGSLPERTCTDPNFPFCDVNGVVGGEPGACVAVSCTAGQFAECRGDQEVRCNAEGNNYEVMQCERGCDVAADGCRLCNPNETACTNGKVATCDATGTVTFSTECALGCFESEPRCRDIVPSNSLATYADMVASPPDLIVEDAEFNSETGKLIPTVGPESSPPSFMVPAPPNGLPIRVVVVDEVKVQRLTLRGEPAVAIVARGDVLIEGSIEVNAGYGTEQVGCDGGYGTYSYTGSCQNSASGGGGGANATNGARGGDVPSLGLVGGAGGITSGSPSLVPLRGGCSGGSVEGPYYPGGGGGALQLTSSTRITVAGTIIARGGNGSNFDVGDSQQPDPHQGASGGGAGGAILLEAPDVALGPNAQLLAFGGDGGALCTTTSDVCGAPGRGAHNGIAATAGGSTGSSCPTSNRTAGGGGGGLGRVRINTRDGAYTKASSALEDASVSTGTIATR